MKMVQYPTIKLTAIQHFFQDLFNTKTSKQRKETQRLEKEQKVNDNIENVRKEWERERLESERLESERLESERLEKEKLNNDLYEVAQSELQEVIVNNQEYENEYIKILEEQREFKKKIKDLNERNEELIDYNERQRNRETKNLKEYLKYKKLIETKPLDFFIRNERNHELEIEVLEKQYYKKIENINNIDEYSEDEKQIKIKNLENQLVKEKEGLLSPVDIWEKFVKKIDTLLCSREDQIKYIDFLCTFLTKQIEAHKTKNIPVDDYYIEYLAYRLTQISSQAVIYREMTLHYIKIFRLLLDPVFNLKDYIYQDAIYYQVYGKGSHENNGEMLQGNGKISEKNQFTIAHFIITIDKGMIGENLIRLIKLLIDSGANFNIKADDCADNKTAAELIFKDVKQLYPENQIPRIKLRIAFINHLLIHTKYLDSLGTIWLNTCHDENTNEYIQEKINHLTKLQLLIEEIPQNTNLMTEEQMTQLEKTIRDKVNKILTIAIYKSSACETEDLQNALRGILNSLPLHEDQCERLKYILSSIENILPNQFNILFDYYKNNDLEILAEKIPKNLDFLCRFSALYKNIKTGKKNLYDFVDEVISQIEKIAIDTQNQNDKEDLNEYKNNLSEHSRKLKEQDIKSALKNNTSKNNFIGDDVGNNIILSKEYHNIRKPLSITF